MISLVATSVVANAAYLFVPGHGLTGKSGGEEDVKTLIGLCKDSAGKRLHWMKIIEKEYEWKSLETTTVPEYAANISRYNVQQIVDDAVSCKRAGMFLRVMILHKYTTYPDYMDSDDNSKDLYIKIGPGQFSYNLMLDKKEAYNRLTKLYTAAINALKSNSEAAAGFYGFVLQETSIGDGSTYYGEDSKDLDQTRKDRRSKWFVNLRDFHTWLAGKLATFDDDDDNGVRGRIFWQMINTPDEEIDLILAAHLKGMGFCGPDTFPGEPSKGDTAKATTQLYRSYDTMRRIKTEFPISLHVYAGNYRHDRPHQDPNMIPGVVSLWKGGNAPAVNGFKYEDAGDGLFNFLGCAGNIGDVPRQDWQIGDRAEDMDVHNIIWSTAKGELKEESGDGVLEYVMKNGVKWYLEAAENMAGGPYGWPEVLKAMQKADGKFIKDEHGGCNRQTPSGIR